MVSKRYSASKSVILVQAVFHSYMKVMQHIAVTGAVAQSEHRFRLYHLSPVGHQVTRVL